MGKLCFELLNENLVLLPEKALFWPNKNLLIIADVHLGKTNHFRSNGIAIPSESASTDINNLYALFKKIKPKRVIFLGDLFHSSHNLEWQNFVALLEKFPATEFTLIIGNHDILETKHYENSGLKLLSALSIAPFYFTHEPEERNKELYNIAGHIHPGVKLKGKGKLSAKIPCFYFGKNGGILPAFGKLTGLHSLKTKKTDSVFGLVGDDVIGF